MVGVIDSSQLKGEIYRSPAALRPAIGRFVVFVKNRQRTACVGGAMDLV
jgi:hypothetical protein